MTIYSICSFFWVGLVFTLHSPGLQAQDSSMQGDPEKAILGDWQGLGMAMLLSYTFQQDHTYSMPDEPEIKGTWSYNSGKYYLKHCEVTREATIDSDGQLIMTDPEIPELRNAFGRKGKLATATSAGTQPVPTGEWRFAYFKRSAIKAAPPFDGITFSPGKATLLFTPVGQSFEVNCRTTGNSFILPTQGPGLYPQLIKYMPLGVQLPKEVKLAFYYEENGSKLVLSNAQAVAPFGCEWVFVRPEALLPVPFAGTWVGKGSYSGSTMELHPDGTWRYFEGYTRETTSASLTRSPQKYYRLWKSPHGDAISMMQLAGDMQLVHVQMARYEMKDKDIILTPIEVQYGDKPQLQKSGLANWKLTSPREAQTTPTPYVGSTTSTLTPFDLAGEWVGNAEGTEIHYVFNPDGSVIWKINESRFKEECPNGLRGKFKLSRGPQFEQIDFYRFDHPEFENMDYRGIFKMVDDYTLKMEGRPDSGRPTEFSIEAVTFKRTGPKPTFDAETIARIKAAAAPPMKPSYKVENLPLDVITLPGSVRLEMVRIPAGSFVMGEAESKKERSVWPLPPQAITFRNDFYIGRFEVTQAQWRAVMGSWPPPFEKQTPYNRVLPHETGPDFPAYFVSWQDCQNFVAALNKHIVASGQGTATFRLPSEAEWEYACRGGTKTRFYWGDDPTLEQIDHYAWYGDNSEVQGDEYAVHRAGMKFPNPWNLFDMAGNVVEWCEDDWLYGNKGILPLADGTPWKNPNPKKDRRNDIYYCVRGGSTQRMATGLTSASRAHGQPPSRDQGMRLARSIAPSR